MRSRVIFCSLILASWPGMDASVHAASQSKSEGVMRPRETRVAADSPGEL